MVTLTGRLWPRSQHHRRGRGLIIRGSFGIKNRVQPVTHRWGCVVMVCDALQRFLKLPNPLAEALVFFVERFALFHHRQSRLPSVCCAYVGLPEPAQDTALNIAAFARVTHAPPPSPSIWVRRGVNSVSHIASSEVATSTSAGVPHSSISRRLACRKYPSS